MRRLTFYLSHVRLRYDVFNLETVDGICVIIEGFINKARSEENGFPSKEIYARKCLEGESTLTSDVQYNQELQSLSPHARSNGGSGKGIAKNIDKACNKNSTDVRVLNDLTGNATIEERSRNASAQSNGTQESVTESTSNRE
ncbi:hypothetical protein M9H77_03544 [Catharanthus roseus]|uniref:Uncharacterized protein n=1 Tax=Catharanthus roseus TaxID=4058 RepID=A0ACC0CC06_CATRO|nr:hypothetical protein M9H77_03544 [Catharanthus roseus]